LATETRSKQYFNLIRKDRASLLKLTKIANFYPQPKDLDEVKCHDIYRTPIRLRYSSVNNLSEKFLSPMFIGDHTVYYILVYFRFFLEYSA